MDVEVAKLFESTTMEEEVAKLFELSKSESFNKTLPLYFKEFSLLPYEEKRKVFKQLLKEGFLEEIMKRPKEEISELGEKINEAFEAFMKI